MALILTLFVTARCLSICPYVVSSNFLVHFLKLYFLERLYDNLTKKYGWHFFGGHFELLAAILIFIYWHGDTSTISMLLGIPYLSDGSQCRKSTILGEQEFLSFPCVFHYRFLKFQDKYLDLFPPILTCRGNECGESINLVLGLIKFPHFSLSCDIFLKCLVYFQTGKSETHFLVFSWFPGQVRILKRWDRL